MNPGFDTIFEHRIPIMDFRLKWRFTEEKYDVIPEDHLQQFIPLDKEASQFLWDYIARSGLHDQTPFANNYFKITDKFKRSVANDSEIKKWLYRRGFPFDKMVFLSWQPGEAMIVPWKLLIKYVNAFYYSGDDLTVIDQSLNWALLCYHEDEVYFGTNEKYKPEENAGDELFIW